MKTTKKLSLIAVVTLITLFSSCSKSDPTPAPTAIISDKTNFKLDGILIVPDETYATYYTNAVAGGKFIDVYAKKDGKQVLELHFPATIGTYPAQHSFNMTSSWLTYIANDGTNNPQDFNSTSGSISFTILNITTDKIRGIFNFVGNNSVSNKNVTDGVLVIDAITHQ